MKKKRLSGIFGAILEYQIYCYSEILYGGGFELVVTNMSMKDNCGVD